MDLNEDGKLDILSGCYSETNFEKMSLKHMAGLFFVLWGKGQGQFSPPEALKGADNKLLIINPGSGATHVDRSSCTRPTAIDWNGDGKIDIVSGNLEGSFTVFLGEGKGLFNPKNTWIRSGDEILKLKQRHSDPTFADIDGDGDLDLLSGSGSGGIFWAENKTPDPKVNRFKLSKFKTLVPPHTKRLTFDSYESAKPSYSSRIWVDDINADGKLDILLGDKAIFEWPKKGIDQKAYEKWRADHEKLLKRNFELFHEIQKLTEEELAHPDEGRPKELAEVRNRLGINHDQKEQFIYTEEAGHVWIYYGK